MHTGRLYVYVNSITQTYPNCCRKHAMCCMFDTVVHVYITCIMTAYCIWSVISSFPNLNRWSSSLGLFYHVRLKRDQGDWNWRLRLNDTPNAIGCTSFVWCTHDMYGVHDMFDVHMWCVMYDESIHNMSWHTRHVQSIKYTFIYDMWCTMYDQTPVSFAKQANKWLTKSSKWASLRGAATPWNACICECVCMY